MKNILIKFVLISVVLISQNTLKADQISHKKTVDKLLEIMEFDKNTRKSFQNSIKYQIQQKPEMAPLKDVMIKFFDTHILNDKLHDLTVNIYMEEYTEKELNDLINFYKTPTGKKTIEKFPEILMKTKMLIDKLIKDHEPELKSMIKEEYKRLYKSKKQ